MTIRVREGVSLDVPPLAAELVPTAGYKRSVVSMQEQIGTMWCWAACVVSAVRSGRGKAYQNEVVLDMADAVLGVGCDPNEIKNGNKPSEASPCNFKLPTSRLESLWRRNGFPPATYQTSRIRPNDLEAALDQQLKNLGPVQAFGGDHVVLIYGWRRDADGSIKLLVMDPECQSLSDGVSPESLFETDPWVGTTLGLAYSP